MQTQWAKGCNKWEGFLMLNKNLVNKKKESSTKWRAIKNKREGN